MNRRHLCKSLVIALPLLLAASLHAADVTNLRCEYLVDPLGIDVVKPRLSWVIEDRDPRSDVRGLKQTAYQVLVASSEELLAKDQGDLWDSGKVASDQSIQVEYAGQPLRSRTRCHWIEGRREHPRRRGQQRGHRSELGGIDRTGDRRTGGRTTGRFPKAHVLHGP